jgi:hypothetical protein
MSVTRNPNLEYHSVLSNPLKQDSLCTDALSDSAVHWEWTGKPPVYGLCPGVSEDGKISSLPHLNLDVVTLQQLLDYFDNTWTLTEVVFSSIASEKAIFYRQPYHQLRHPMIFYYAHPAALYINKFRVAGLLSEPVNEHFEQLFETGVDEMSWDDLSRNETEWPDVHFVTQYRAQVYKIVCDVIKKAELSGGINMNKKEWAIVMGFEHERIHIETSSVLLREVFGFILF